MAINYASKYSNQIDEKFRVGMLTAPAINEDYDFTGVRTVNVYSIPTVAMNDYSLIGTSRYGTVSELQNTCQELRLSRDRSFTFTIDRRSNNDAENAMNAGEALNRQLELVVMPEIDKYRLDKMCSHAGNENFELTTKDNAYEMFLKANESLTDNMVPQDGRVAFVSPEFYRMVKLDPAFMIAGAMTDEIKLKGFVGMIDNCTLIMTPKSYLGENDMFIIIHNKSMVSPIKLAEYKIHDNPPGINGWLVEGRVFYDAFILNNKCDGIYVHRTE